MSKYAIISFQVEEKTGNSLRLKTTSFLWQFLENWQAMLQEPKQEIIAGVDL